MPSDGLDAFDWESHPPYDYPPYRSTAERSPRQKLVPMPDRMRHLRAPLYGSDQLGELDHDLTRNTIRKGEPLGEQIVVTGRVFDERGKPIPDALVEIWQANAAGRYVHKGDQHDAPLDPNFLGAGRCLFGQCSQSSSRWQRRP
jgi:protocatechuate 3,4-dioxygenase beta subunit